MRFFILAAFVTGLFALSMVSDAEAGADAEIGWVPSKNRFMGCPKGKVVGPKGNCITVP
jgi:hypothetical protein